MYVEVVPNRGSPPAVLLRESVREGPRIRKRTLANLSAWPPEKVALLRHVLRGDPLVPPADAVEILRTRPHGHVAAVLGTLRRLDLERCLDAQPSRRRDLSVAMIVARLLDPCSKLATARGLDEDTLSTSLGELLHLERTDADELNAAMDWLLARQPRVEAKLARRHVADGGLVLYDVTSTYFEGRTCPLAQFGHNRDGKRDKVQIVFGVLCTAEGCPVAVEVFNGHTGDPTTLAPQVQKLRERFGVERVVLIGDRGLITEARIRQDLQPAGWAWITALRTTAIRHLVEQGTLQFSLFDERDLAELTSPDYPGERLIVCRNPLLAEERARKREALVRATEDALVPIAAATRRARQPLRGEAEIGKRVGAVLGRYKVGKHFRIEIAPTTFSYTRDAARIAQEAALDGLYVIRTNVAAGHLSAPEAVRAYKRLSTTDRAFRSFKTVYLHVRPIYHHLAERVRAHVFLCLLAYYVEWHMRRALAPMIFDDEDPAAGEAQRASVVAPAQRSPQAQRKAQRLQTDDGIPVHSFAPLLQDLATVAKNRVRLGSVEVDIITTPTPLQQRAFDLLSVPYRG
jgi:transposase